MIEEIKFRDHNFIRSERWSDPLDRTCRQDMYFCECNSSIVKWQHGQLDLYLPKSIKYSSIFNYNIDEEKVSKFPTCGELLLKEILM